MSEPILDLAVVGGGISGVYTAWRYLTAGAGNGEPPPRVALFECSQRIGGRLYSHRMPGVPHIPVELGGMRFLNIHTRVASLVEHLGLSHRTLPVDDPKEANLVYLRGRHSTAADWNRPAFSPPYRLDQDERLRPPGDLMIRVALKYEEAAKAGRLYDRGFWNLLYDELSAEAYSLVKEAGGYYTLVNNWNAGVAVPFLLADFGVAAEYRALVDGFQTLPETLADQFSEHHGDIRPGHRLHRLVRDTSGSEPLVELHFDTTDPEDFGHHRRVSNPEIHRARQVVLALPRRAIELLHPDSLIFDSPQFEEDLRSVLPQPAFKIFAAYHTPWWEHLRDVSAGRSVTDLPIRQCYYWGSEAQDGADPWRRNSILMASYSDGASAEFWAGLATDKEKHRVDPRFFAAVTGGADQIDGLQAPAGMIKELQAQLRELHGLADIPDPYETVYKDWAGDPFGGGWHFWKIGQDPDQVMPRIQHPVPDAKVYICGEAWSHQQGWVEGALETADAVLAEHLGVAAPPWVAPPPPRLMGVAGAEGVADSVMPVPPDRRFALQGAH